MFPDSSEGWGSNKVPICSVFFFMRLQNSYSSGLIAYCFTLMLYNTLSFQDAAGISAIGKLMVSLLSVSDVPASIILDCSDFQQVYILSATESGLGPKPVTAPEGLKMNCRSE